MDGLGVYVPCHGDAAIGSAKPLGEVRHFEASYLQSWLTQDAWGARDKENQWLWRLSTAHGSKVVLGDLGIHILDFTTLIADLEAVEMSCRLATFDKAPDGRLGDFVLGANDSATMQLVLSNGALGTVAATRFASGHLNDLRLRLYGTRGGLEVQFERNVSRLMACRAPDLKAANWQEVVCPEVPRIYERLITAIRGTGPAEPDFVRGAALQRLLDRAERSAAQSGTGLKI